MILAEKILNRNCAPTETLKAMEQIAWEVWKYKSMYGQGISNWDMMGEDLKKYARLDFDEWYHKQIKL